MKKIIASGTSIPFLIFAGLFFMYSYNLNAQCSWGEMGKHDGMNSHDYKNPAVAALLSIQPMPIAVGNFYTGDWGRGTLYTATELALFIPGMILVIDNSGWWGHNRYDGYYNASYSNTNWTKEERNTFYYLLAGYVVVKIISAFDAGYSAEQHNTNYALQYDEQSKALSLAFRYSF
ncbi:MAG: hypothetical protein COW85_15700 [Ignavibacteria bacterium CG22_combo_CG10-13_8_21_14_all_37_15]|nr:hypothetical protein [Ignavibacteria bacterium]PIP76162.1 MAG: hypothetical protein COW85_15700 [Ignavibacteria bacterium CG22_combo_CG10-13_8_21_14_all_37_15]